MKEASGFHALIDQLAAATEGERAAIEARIWREYGATRAVLSLDMSHFSPTVRRSGILAYLALIRRMQVVTAPIVAAHRGRAVKYEADNLIAVFTSSRDAALAAVAIQACVGTGDAGFTVAIGIDEGQLVLVEDGDLYGDPVNVACKLGEDLARPGEVLLTRCRARRAGGRFPPRARGAGGFDFGPRVHRVVGPARNPCLVSWRSPPTAPERLP